MPVSQHKIYQGRRFIARVDFAYPDHLLALEYEGDHHRHRDVFRSDIDRLNRMRLLGWTVLRFTAEEVEHAPERVLSQLGRTTGL
jgi:very-short-patch-repair endonuclease